MKVLNSIFLLFLTASYSLAALPGTSHLLGNTYWTNNTGGNTNDGFAVSTNTGAVRQTNADSFYFVSADVNSSGNQYVTVTFLIKKGGTIGV